MRRSRVVHEGWMVRYGRRKIGRSYIHMRYFVLESRFLAYYKKKPQDGVVPVKTLLIDGNCRVEDQGVKTHHGHMVYVLSVYNKKDTSNRMTMAAYSIQEALSWKEKLESIIDQQQGAHSTHGNKYYSFEYRYGLDNGRNASSSDRDAAEDDDDDCRPDSPHRTIGNGPPESVLDWTDELDSNLPNQNYNSQAFSRKHWRLLQCQNGLRIFEELLEVDFLPKSCSKAMKAVGIVEATCEETFELIMRMDATRCEWDCSFQYGSLVEEVDGHTAILYQRLQLDWFSMFVWPRDLCYVRYWRRNDDGTYVVLFRSREHESCGRQPGYVRAHIESGGFNISRLKPRGGRPRTKVQHLMQIDLRGWGAGYFSSFQQHCLLQMLNSVAASMTANRALELDSSPVEIIYSGIECFKVTVAGLREYFSQTDERAIAPRMPVMVNMTSASDSSKKSKRFQSTSFCFPNSSNRMMDEYSDDDEDFQYADEEVSASEDKRNEASEEEPELDMTIYFGNLRRDDQDNARNCWTLSDGNNFRVRGKNFCSDKSKTAGGKPLMDLVAADWFKSTKRIDHVAQRLGCAAQVAADRGHFSIVINLQVPGSTHYSMVFYFVTKKLVPGSLLQRFVDGDDEFRNSRLKLIPSVPKGSWIVRQSVGSTPCLLGKSVDCTYIRGPSYLEIDVDIGSSTVANGVLGLVIGVITTLVVDMAFIVQGNTPEELPERLIGAVRISHLELSSAREPRVEDDF